MVSQYQVCDRQRRTYPVPSSHLIMPLQENVVHCPLLLTLKAGEHNCLNTK